HLSALTPSRDHEQHRALTRCSSKKSESKQRTGVSALPTITSFTVFRVRHRRRNGRHRDLLDRLPDVLLVLRRRLRSPPPLGRPSRAPSGRAAPASTDATTPSTRLKFGSSSASKSAPPSITAVGEPCGTAGAGPDDERSASASTSGGGAPPIFARCSFRIAFRDSLMRLPSTARTFTST